MTTTIANHYAVVILVRQGRLGTPLCSSAELWFAEKHGGHKEKISVVDLVFLFVIGFYIHHRPGNFSLRPEKFPKRFSFGGGRARFFLLCKVTAPRQQTSTKEQNLINAD